MTHHVKAGLIPSWTGSEQSRHFKFDHGCLIIGAGNQKLTWKRAVKHIQIEVCPEAGGCASAAKVGEPTSQSDLAKCSVSPVVRSICAY